MPRVCVDPGHGGRDTGARTADGRDEKESNLRAALKVEALLKARGVEVLMTRREDVSVSLSDRWRLANDRRADVFLSLHADAAGSSGPHGHHAIHTIHGGPGRELARLLVDEVERATGRPRFPASGSWFGGPGDGTWSRRGESDPSRDFYAVIRETAMPAVILERGFLTNPEDARLLFDDAFLSRQAEGIARAVCAFLGLPFIAPPPPPDSPVPPVPPVPPATPSPAAARVVVLGREVAGELRGDAVWAPVRPVAEALGAEVAWDEATRTATVTPRRGSPDRGASRR